MKIIHNDSRFVVVDKPGGLLSVPGHGLEKQDCVVNRLKKILPDCMDQQAVHRLDMATSGLMVLALDAETHRNLSRQLFERRVQKKYIAMLEGVIDPEKGESGEITLGFRLDPNNRPYQVYDPVQGKIGISRWHVLKICAGRTAVEFTPLTGRTHQLRLHAAPCNYAFIFSPENREWMEFFSPVPF